MGLAGRAGGRGSPLTASPTSSIPGAANSSLATSKTAGPLTVGR